MLEFLPDVLLFAIAFSLGVLWEWRGVSRGFRRARKVRDKYGPPKTHDSFRRIHKHRYEERSREVTNGEPWVVEVCSDPTCAARNRRKVEAVSA